MTISLPHNDSPSIVNYNIESYKLNYRACIPLYVLLDPDLTANEIRLYCLIEQMESSTGDVYYTSRKLSEILSVDHGGGLIRRMLRKLKKKNYLDRKLRNVLIKGKLVARHCWNIVKGGLIMEEEENEKTVLGVPGGAVLGVPGGAVLGVPPCNALNLNALKKEKDPPLSPKGEDGAPKNSKFETFWSAYPSKKAKKFCLTIWTRKKLDGRHLDIMQKLEQQKTQDEQWRRGFIPNPSTYLNQERWEDEISGSQPQHVTEAKAVNKEISQQRINAQEQASIDKSLREMEEWKKRRA